jgi:TolB-like protein
MLRKSVLVLLVSFACCWGRAFADSGSMPEGKETVTAAKTVAVLDFQDLGPSVELAPLRRALAKMLTTDLTGYGPIQVVTRERVDKIIQETHLGESGLVSPDSAQRTGQALAADYLVQGSFSGSDQGLKVHLEIFDVEQGKILGEAEAAGKPEEAFVLEEKLLAETVRILQLKKLTSFPISPPSQKQTILAVLYLQNLSPDPHLDPLQTGLTDLLIAQLQDRSGLAAVEREQLDKILAELGLQQSALADNSAAARIGQMLGAQVMLSGSFLVMKDTIRFDAHLSATDSGIMLKAVSAQGKADDLLPVLRTLAEQVAAALALPPSPAPASLSQGRTSLEGALHFSRGRAFTQTGDYASAAEEFERACYLDPDNLLAQEWLANSYDLTCRRDKAIAVWERLSAIDSEHFMQYFPMLVDSYLSNGQPEKALELSEKAWEKVTEDENNPCYLQVIDTLARINSFIARQARAQRRAADPDSALPSPEEIQRYQEAKRWGLLAVDKQPAAEERLGARFRLAAILDEYDPITAMAQLETVATAGTKIKAFQPFLFATLQWLSRLYFETKDHDRGQEFFGRLIAGNPNTPIGGVAQYYLAEIKANSGHEEEAAELYAQMGERWWRDLDLAPSAAARAIGLYRKLGNEARADKLACARLARFGYANSPDRNLLPDDKIFPDDKPRPILIREGDLLAGEENGFPLRANFNKDEQLLEYSASPINNRLLFAYGSVFLIDTFRDPLQDDEIEYLRGFVACGGDLFLDIGDEFGQKWMMFRLLSVFGLEAWNNPGELITTGSGRPEPVHLNPHRRALPGIQAPYVMLSKALCVPPETVIADYQGQPVLASLRYGLGRIILSGLAMHNQRPDGKRGEWDEINCEFLRNAANWMREADKDNPANRAFEVVQRKLVAVDMAGALNDLQVIQAKWPKARAGEEALLLLADIYRRPFSRLPGVYHAEAAQIYRQLETEAKDPQIRTLARLNLARIAAAGDPPRITEALAKCWQIWREDPSGPWAAVALLEGAGWAYNVKDFEAAQSAADQVMNSPVDQLDRLSALARSMLCRQQRGDIASARRLYQTLREDYPLGRLRDPQSDDFIGTRDFTDRYCAEFAQ